MKNYVPVSLEQAPQDLKDLDAQIKDVSIYLQLVAQGQYPGLHAEHVVKLKSFMSSIRDQLIDAHDVHSFVVAAKQEPEESKQGS